LKVISSPSDRIWFWVKDPTDDSTSAFNWSRDSIYGAAVLLGAGSITCLVMSLTFVSYVVGKYTVSHTFMPFMCNPQWHLSIIPNGA